MLIVIVLIVLLAFYILVLPDMVSKQKQKGRKNKELEEKLDEYYDDPIYRDGTYEENLVCNDRYYDLSHPFVHKGEIPMLYEPLCLHAEPYYVSDKDKEEMERFKKTNLFEG